MGNPETYWRFWKEFLPELRAKGWTQATSPSTRSYMRLPSSRRSVLHYSASFCSSTNRPPADRLRVHVCIENRNGEAKTNKKVFNKLHRRKKRIEATVGECLVWERLDNIDDSGAYVIKRSSISLYFGGFIQITDEERWLEARKWLIDALGRMRDAFNPVLKELPLSHTE